MSGLLIRNFPPELHRKLKEEAHANHRSMGRQALVMLEQVLEANKVDMADITPLEPGFIMTQDWLDKTRAEGRK